MFIYAASGPVLDPLLAILDLNGVGYTPVWPNDEPIMGFFRTKLAPAELLPYLEASQGRGVSIIPLSRADVADRQIRQCIRRKDADLGYITDASGPAIQSPDLSKRVS